MPSVATDTLPRLLDQVAARYADKVFARRRNARGGEPSAFATLRRDVREAAAGLSGLGIGRGDKIALIAENCYEWIVADLACSYIGAVNVPRGTDTAPSEIDFILQHSECRMAFAETDAVARRLLDGGFVPKGFVCVLSPKSEVDGAMGLQDLNERGAKWQAEGGDLDAVSQAVQASDLLTIVYTSGTTAEPKGVMLTQGNITTNITQVRAVLPFDDGDVFLSVLPAWHSYERMMDYVALACGSELVYTDRRRIKEDLRAVKPTVFAAVPRIWESIHDGIVNHVVKQPPARRWLLTKVLANCRRIGEGTAGPHHRILHRLFERTILPKFRGAAGGNMRFPVSGGGSLPRHIDACLLGMGLPILNGYGLTETAPVAAIRSTKDNRCGTIGHPMPDTEIEIRDESGRTLPTDQSGQVWIKGPQVMQGYYKNQSRTDLVLVEGWFNSGDLGAIDARGHVRITGRAKDTIVLAGGENVEPEPLETSLKTSPLIDQALVLGQDEKALGAIIVAMPDALVAEIPREEWGEQNGVLTSERVRKLYRDEIERLLAADHGFRAIERVRPFRVILEALSIENGLLTQTLKVKRHKVASYHEPLIQEMFA